MDTNPSDAQPEQMELPFTTSASKSTSHILPTEPSSTTARTSASPGKALALLVNDLVYGTSSDGLLARFDPDSCSWRTFQLSLFGEEPKWLDILPRWGMTRGGELWQRPTPERPTAGSVGGAWVTATASDTISVRTPVEMAAHFAKHRPGRTTPPSLREHVQYGNNWATPAAFDMGYRTMPHKTVLMGNKPYRVTSNGNHSNLGLNGHVQYHGQPTGAYLNPEWVEMLMGYPPGYTDIETEQED